MSNHTPVAPQQVTQEKLIIPGAAINGGALAAATQAAQAAEPSLWKRYSPHHEFPLSVLATFVMYFSAVLMVLVLGGLVLNLWGLRPEMPIENIAWAGGGGDPDGIKESHVNHGLQDALALGLTDDGSDLNLTTQKPDLSAPDATDRLQNQTKSKPFKGDNSWGKGGPGTDGGKGPGKGPGDGPGDGPGKQSKREDRMHRWVVNFNYSSGADYLRRLHELGAYLAFPEADQKYRLYEDLGKRPPSGRLGTVADLQQWNRIYWRDGGAGSCDAIASALNLSITPPHFWIFLPVELEKELFEKEKAYRALSEEDIIKRNLETVFTVERIGSQFSVKVLRQDRKSAGK